MFVPKTIGFVASHWLKPYSLQVEMVIFAGHLVTFTGPKVISLMGTIYHPRYSPMPETTKTTVTQDKDGYYRVRVPKALGDALDLAGKKVQWEVESQRSLKIVKDD